MILLGKKNCERKERGSCKSYDPECRVGGCSRYPYPKEKEVVREKEVHDTG